MKFILIQISDIHLKGPGSPASTRLKELPKALRNLDSDITTAVVLLSGDIAFSGRKEEYEVADSDMAALLTGLGSTLNGASLHLFAVPGNHDCDFKHPIVQARKLLLDSLARSSAEAVNESTLGICCQVHENFFAFLDCRETSKPTFKVAGAYYEYLVPVGNAHILFRCFNTALASMLPENAGKMVFPLSLLHDRTINPAPAYTVGMFHHPYNWLAPNIKLAFGEHVERTCDAIFTGHEHTTAYYKKESFSGLVTDYIEGAAFQEHGTDECGFNVVLVNLTTSQERLFSFQWNTDHFSKEEITDGWRPFRRSRSRREFELTDAMAERLQDPGATFAHPSKQKLLLEDIYVPPNAQELTFKDGKDLVRNGSVASKDLLNFIANKHRVLIIGKERSGKSSLAKVLFRQYYTKNMVPILVEGDEIKDTDADRFVRLVEGRLKQDYKNPLLDKFNRLTDDRVVLIIDDFDHANLNARGRLKLLEAIHKRFQRIVIFGDDLLRFEEMTSGELGPKILSDYTQLELMEYGHVLRSAIVDKWYDVNREYISNPEELARKVTQAERLVDEVLGKSYLPSYPIFILTMLQGVDTAATIDTSAGSYGYLYTVLITKQLAVGSKELTVDKKSAYLVELAYQMFKTRRRELSQQEFNLFHQHHCARYVALDQKLIVSELESAGILELYHDNYRFKYTYFYYYFVAEYFTRHIEEADVRACIEKLCEEIQKEEHANIWLFLTHQSRSTFVLDTIVKHATKFFTEIVPPKFEEDIQFLVKLYDKVPELVYVTKSTEELRQERRARLDTESHGPSDAAEETEETNEGLKTIAKLVAALRTLEVMGQIVKNYAGSMRNEPKFILVKQCYDLGLRVIGAVLTMWQESGEEIVQHALDVILRKEDNIESKQELERLVKQFIFFFCEAVSFSIIKRISHAVGTKDLNDVYNDVLAKNPTNAYRLLDLSVKLDSVGFSTGTIYDLHDQLKGNVFCTRLLSHLVIHHFYLFNTSEQTKQKVCSKLGIKMQTLRGIDVATGAQKRLPTTAGG